MNGNKANGGENDKRIRRLDMGTALGSIGAGRAKHCRCKHAGRTQEAYSII